MSSHPQDLAGKDGHCLLSTLRKLKLEYHRATMSIPWQLNVQMTWFLAMPGHQKRQHISNMQYKQCSFPMGQDFNYLCHINAEKWIINKYIGMFLKNKLSTRFKTLRLQHNGWQFADDILIFQNKNSKHHAELKFYPQGMWLELVIT